MTGRYYIKQAIKKDLDAGPKAKADTYKTLDKEGFIPIVYISDAKGRLSRYYHSLLIILKTLRLSNAIVFMENPITNWRFLILATQIMRFRKNHLILLIHDVEGERYDFARHLEDKYMSCFNSIIVHNQIMKSFLADRLDPNIKLYPLGIFDYLLNNVYKQNLVEPLQTQSIPQKWDVIYCGNLNRVKSSFIYLVNKLDKKNWLLNLYGLGLEEDIQTITTKYHGSFDPNMPIIEAGSHFGLIWDGDSIETCSGVYGKYLKMNNPHKLSLYIAINMPIIIWEQAALADFVINNGIGFTISSLHDIDDKLLNITYKEYQAFKNNLKQFNKNVTTGQYLTLSLKQVRQHL